MRIRASGTVLATVFASCLHEDFPRWTGADPNADRGRPDDSASRRVWAESRLRSPVSGTRQGDPELEDGSVGGQGEHLAARAEDTWATGTSSLAIPRSAGVIGRRPAWVLRGAVRSPTRTCCPRHAAGSGTMNRRGRRHPT